MWRAVRRVAGLVSEIWTKIWHIAVEKRANFAEKRRNRSFLTFLARKLARFDESLKPTGRGLAFVLVSAWLSVFNRVER